MFTIINNSITTSRKSTVRSALVGEVSIGSSVVTELISVSSSISAFLPASVRTSITVNEVSVIALFLSIFDAIATSRKLAVSSAVSSVGSKVTLFTSVQNTITAVWVSAVGSAAAGNSVVIEGSLIALLTSLDNSVSAKELAVGAASGSFTFLTESRIKNSITTSGEFAVGSADSVTSSVGVNSKITFLSGIENSVTADEFAETIAVGATIALLAVERISDSITASRQATVRSANVGPGRGGSFIASLTVISDSISASGESAVGSADIGRVRVSSSIVALFVSFQESVTAVQMAELVASRGSDSVLSSKIALFMTFLDSITANVDGTISSAVRLVFNTSGWVSARVALFTTIDDTITARWEFTVGSASTGSDIRVHRSIIALLTLINNSVVGSAVRELRNVEVELRQEGRSRGSDVVQESKGNVRSVSLDVDELSFQIGVFSVDGVLRGRVEFNSLEIGSIKSVSVGRNKDKLSSGVNNLNAIGNVDVGGETSSSGVDSSSGSEVNVDR